jgi:uncharacterized protein YceK
MKILILIGLMTLAGCGTTTTQTTLKNSNGQVRYCYLANDHTLISVGAMTEYNKCLNDAGTAGFKRVE